MECTPSVARAGQCKGTALQRRPVLPRQLLPLQHTRGDDPCAEATSSWRSGSRVHLSSGWPSCTVLAAGTAGLLSQRPWRRSRSRLPWRQCNRAIVRCGGETLEAELTESLRERTLEALDFDYVVERLREHVWTAPAWALVEEPAALLAASPEEARALYAMVLELTMLEDTDLVLNDRLDVLAKVESCAGGVILKLPQLKDVAAAIEALLQLRNGIEKASIRGAQIPELLAAVERITLPDEVLDIMLHAFDTEGELSAEKFPEISTMRQRINDLEGQCRAKMKEVLMSGRYRKYLTDDGYTQLNDRYTLSVRPKHVGRVGEAISESRSGNVVFVEPRELVNLSREMTELQRELVAAIRQIMNKMCVAIARATTDFKASLQVAGEIDLARARLFLGEDMEGEVPDIGDEGVIAARHVRNPCLLLRNDGNPVIGNRLELGTGSQGLVLSGPNAGGKTVVLKSIGLLALLARCGIPIPAGESARVDFFDVVLADIGDMQTIVDDLSTYSAHLVASRIILGCARSAGPRALVMMDEAGTGTDPMQGAAMARAVLEALLEAGTRVVVTTHCMQLKDWALEDPRTQIAAMEYKKGLPTYRLMRNAIGESHAIETARRLELPLPVVERAEALVSEDQRALMALQRQAQALEEQLQRQLEQARKREKHAAAAAHQAAERERALAIKEVELQAAETEMQIRRDQLQGQLRAERQAQAEAQKQRLQELLRGLKAKSGTAGVRIVGETLEELRLERDEDEEAARAAKERAKHVPSAMGKADALQVGDWVVVLARTPWYGFKGRVQHISTSLGGKPARVRVEVDGSRNKLELIKTQLAKTSPPVSTRPGQRKVRKKARNLANAW